MFYEHIIPAVLDVDAESVLTVLKAFQYGKAVENRCDMVNAFEAALAIYFLNEKVIRQIWTDSEKEPCQESSTVWLSECQIPDLLKDQCRVAKGSIEFKGVMTDSQKQALLNVVGADCRPYV